MISVKVSKLFNLDLINNKNKNNNINSNINEINNQQYNNAYSLPFIIKSKTILLTSILYNLGKYLEFFRIMEINNINALDLFFDQGYVQLLSSIFILAEDLKKYNYDELESLLKLDNQNFTYLDFFYIAFDKFLMKALQLNFKYYSFCFFPLSLYDTLLGYKLFVNEDYLTIFDFSTFNLLMNSLEITEIVIKDDLSLEFINTNLSKYNADNQNELFLLKNMQSKYIKYLITDYNLLKIEKIKKGIMDSNQNYYTVQLLIECRNILKFSKFIIKNKEFLELMNLDDLIETIFLVFNCYISILDTTEFEEPCCLPIYSFNYSPFNRHLLENSNALRLMKNDLSLIKDDFDLIKDIMIRIKESYDLNDDIKNYFFIKLIEENQIHLYLQSVMSDFYNGTFNLPKDVLIGALDLLSNCFGNFNKDFYEYNSNYYNDKNPSESYVYYFNGLIKNFAKTSSNCNNKISENCFIFEQTNLIISLLNDSRIMNSNSGLDSKILYSSINVLEMFSHLILQSCTIRKSILFSSFKILVLPVINEFLEYQEIDSNIKVIIRKINNNLKGSNL